MFVFQACNVLVFFARIGILTREYLLNSRHNSQQFIVIKIVLAASVFVEHHYLPSFVRSARSSGGHIAILLPAPGLCHHGTGRIVTHANEQRCKRWFREPNALACALDLRRRHHAGRSQKKGLSRGVHHIYIFSTVAKTKQHQEHFNKNHDNVARSHQPNKSLPENTNFTISMSPAHCLSSRLLYDGPFPIITN